MSKSDHCSGEDTACISMTGFSRASGESDTHLIGCEIKAVNSRYLDTVVRIGRELSAIEPLVRKQVSSFCKRGRVEVMISAELRPDVVPTITCSAERFEFYFSASEKLLSERKLWSKSAQEQLAADLLIRKDIFQEENKAKAVDLAPYESVIKEALASLRDAQRKEGVVLANDVLGRREKIVVHLADIATVHNNQREHIEQTLREKLKELLSSGSLPEERIIAEAAILVERTDIAEEITRLESHLNQFVEIVKESLCGRKLDFLLQECVREINTIASKIQNADAQHLVVEVKAQLERMKEQVQNIE